MKHVRDERAQVTPPRGDLVLFDVTTVAIPGTVGAGCGDQFGSTLASTSLGLVTIFLGIGQVLGPYLAGRMADSFGTLKYSYLLAAGVFFAGAVLSAFLRESRPAAGPPAGRPHASVKKSGEAK